MKVKLREAPGGRARRRSLLTRRVGPGAAFCIIGAILLLRLFVVETAIVEGDSMLPTLSSGDRVLVFQRRAPKRFSIVVFSDPLDGSISIKRVIGLPGEVIEIRSLPRANQQQAPVQGHAVLVNREPLSEPYAVTDVPVSAEPFKVPAGELYLLGDNRGNSLDSRDYGPVKRSAVRGTAVAVYYPLSHFKWLRPPKG